MRVVVNGYNRFDACLSNRSLAGDHCHMKPFHDPPTRGREGKDERGEWLTTLSVDDASSFHSLLVYWYCCVFPSAGEEPKEYMKHACTYKLIIQL